MESLFYYLLSCLGHRHWCLVGRGFLECIIVFSKGGALEWEKKCDEMMSF